MLSYKKLICLLLSLVLCVGVFVGCQSDDKKTDGDPDTKEESSEESTDEESTDEETTSEDTTEDEMKLEEHTYKLSEIKEKIKTYGRTFWIGDELTCDFTASGIYFCVCAEGDITLTVKSNAEAYFTVFVDGVRSETRYKVNAGTNDLVIANIPEAGDHTICVLKQTEAMNAICSFTKLNMVGHLSTEREPANRDLYIEFLGDSITCGYGNLCASNADNPGNAYNQDGTQSFAFLTAQALNADFSMVSCSGVGITNGYRPFTFDTFFAKHSYFRDQTTAYTPSRIPDLVVINLGTNDRTKGTDTAQYQTDVGELIDQVRAKYGSDVPIVWITNMMNDAYYPQLLSAINGKGGASAGLYLALLNNNRDGGNGHPNLAAHQLASEKLIEFLETKNVLQ